jgi:PHD/YefM family antitoxin component YafN of YafNO toxin-antitoxin module
MSSQASQASNQPGMKICSLSEARHDFNLFPKRFETQPEPVLVEHQGNLVMALVGMETFSMFVASMQFLEQKELKDEFFQWMEQQHQHVHDENCQHGHDHGHHHHDHA